MIALLSIIEANLLSLVAIGAEMRGSSCIRTICFVWAAVFFILSFTKRARG